MGRDERISRLKEMWREYLVASTSVDLMREKLQIDPSFGTDLGWSHRDFRAWNDHIDGAFMIRFYAIFESALRDAWRLNFRQATRPQMRDLLEAISARSNMPRVWHDKVSRVRLYRNSLIHHGEQSQGIVPLVQVHNDLTRYLSRIPTARW